MSSEKTVVTLPRWLVSSYRRGENCCTGGGLVGSMMISTGHSGHGGPFDGSVLFMATIPRRDEPYRCCSSHCKSPSA